MLKLGMEQIPSGTLIEVYMDRIQLFYKKKFSHIRLIWIRTDFCVDTRYMILQKKLIEYNESVPFTCVLYHD